MSKKGRPKKPIDEKKNWKDKLECPLCGVSYIRANQTRHKKSKMHRLIEKYKNEQYGGESNEIKTICHPNIDNNVEKNKRNIFSGNAEEIKERIRNIAKF